MTLFALCSDEDMEAVFYDLDFPTKCKFRRCSHRWSRLLRSANALHTVVYVLSSDRVQMSWDKAVDVLQSVLPHVVNLAVIADPAQDPLERLIIAGLERPANQQYERRLYLCNFQAHCYCLHCTYVCAAFDWIELRSLALPGGVVRNALLNSFLDESQDTRHFGYDNADFFPLNQYDPIGLAGLALQFDGVYVFKSPLDVVGVDATTKTHIMTKLSSAALFDLVKENMSHLTQQETLDMLERLRLYDENGVQGVQADFLWILKV